MSETNVINRTDGLSLVCRVSDVGPGEMKACSVDGFPPLAVFNIGGSIYVTSNVCTHQIALLTNGYFEDGIVECPLHGGAFDVVTGEPAQPPCEQSLPVFPVTVIEGRVYIGNV